MNKLEYDNLYKFLVSLGIILIVLPVAVWVYVCTVNPILISKQEFELLSEFSLNIINTRSRWTTVFIYVFPIVAVISVVVGAKLFHDGLSKWINVQNNLDKKLDAEATMQTLTLLEMTSKEVAEKIEEEVKESDESASEHTGTMTYTVSKTSIDKYMQIEELSSKYIERKFLGLYDFKRNIRIGHYGYDIIGVSKNSNIDLVVEVKYCREVKAYTRNFMYFMEKCVQAGRNYEAIAHRNFTCLLFVVMPRQEVEKFKSIEETYMKKYGEYGNRVQFVCVAEEELIKNAD